MISRSVHRDTPSRPTLVELRAQPGEQPSQNGRINPADRGSQARSGRLASLGGVSEQAPDEATEETAAPSPADARPAGVPGVPDEPVLPDRGADDTDRGWGEPSEDDDPDERLRRDVPPHW